MKRFRVMLIFTAMILSLTSCASDDNKQEKSSSTDNSKISESSAVETSSVPKNKDVKEQSGASEIINQVIEHEEEWLSVINKHDESYSYYNIPAAGGDDYIWFQDMDMDGQPDFVTLSKYMPGTDVGTFRAFNIYTNDKGNLISHLPL